MMIERETETYNEHFSRIVVTCLIRFPINSINNSWPTDAQIDEWIAYLCAESIKTLLPVQSRHVSKLIENNLKLYCIMEYSSNELFDLYLTIINILIHDIFSLNLYSSYVVCRIVDILLDDCVIYVK